MEKSKYKVALIGNPNCGKTSIFNALTGLKQKTGNYPGITVSKKSGRLSNNTDIEIIDIPGLYDLYPNSYDEAIVVEELINGKDTLSGIVFIADSSQLDKSLLLFSQVVDLGFPVLFVLNMIDLAQKNKVEIHIEKLKSLTGTNIISTNAKAAKDIQLLSEPYLLKNSIIPTPIFGATMINFLLRESTVLDIRTGSRKCITHTKRIL